MTALQVIRTEMNAAGAKRQPELVALQTQIFQATRAVARPIKGLMSWVVDRRNLSAAWDRVNSAEGADTPGPDGVTCAQLRSRVGDWLASLADDLFHRRYVPGGPRWIDVPKPNKPGETRRIGILSVRDRVAQNALRQVLELILEPSFRPTSFGFRPGRSVAGALQFAAAALSAPPGRGPDYLFVASLDVADCFPTIEHTCLMTDLGRHLADAEVLDLISRTVAAGGEVAGRLWWQRRCGLVQGGPLSPLLCNLALHPLDEAAARLGRETQQGVLVLRYADDLLLLARDDTVATRAMTTLRGVLKARWQRFKTEPTPSAASSGVDWLGVRLQPRQMTRPGEIAFGHVVPEAKAASMIQRLIEMTTLPSDKIDAAAFNLGRWIVSVNAQLRDWRQAYLFADNAPDLFRLLDTVAFDRVGELLKAVTGVSVGPRCAATTWFGCRVAFAPGKCPAPASRSSRRWPHRPRPG